VQKHGVGVACVGLGEEVFEVEEAEGSEIQWIPGSTLDQKMGWWRKPYAGELQVSDGRRDL
jgi:hypothetical protein